MPHDTNVQPIAKGTTGGTPASVVNTLQTEKVTLKFDTAVLKFIQCEKRGDATKSCEYVAQAVAIAPVVGAMEGLRSFELPVAWSMADSTWAVESTAESWVDANKRFVIIIDDKRHDVGKSDAPVKMTLDPHWQFFRWIYYDRWMKGDKRISIPQIWVDGVADASVPAPPRDSFSNWNHGGAADGFLLNFLTMLGIPKVPADLVEADLLPIVKKLITVGPDVKKI